MGETVNRAEIDKLVEYLEEPSGVVLFMVEDSDDYREQLPDVAELRAALPALGCGRRGRRAGSHVARAGSGPGDPVSDPLFYALRAARNILIDRSRRPITTAIDDLHTAPMDAEAKGCE